MNSMNLPASTVAVQDHEILGAALSYSSRGWSIIPVRGKAAACLWKPFQNQAADESVLRKMFRKAGVTGLGVVLGSALGGLAVRDFDQVSAYERWAEAHPHEAARLPTSQTARGFHVYAVMDDEQYVTFPDGELRANSGHYVLLPPSLHPSGLTYTWRIPLPTTGTPLPRLPDSLLCRQSSNPKTTQQIHCMVYIVYRPTPILRLPLAKHSHPAQAKETGNCSNWPEFSRD